MSFWEIREPHVDGTLCTKTHLGNTGFDCDFVFGVGEWGSPNHLKKT